MNCSGVCVWGGGDRLFIGHTAQSCAESTESQDEGVRTPHAGTEKLSSVPVHMNVMSGKWSVKQLLKRICKTLASYCLLSSVLHEKIIKIMTETP